MTPCVARRSRRRATARPPGTARPARALGDLRSSSRTVADAPPSPSAFAPALGGDRSLRAGMSSSRVRRRRPIPRPPSSRPADSTSTAIGRCCYCPRPTPPCDETLVPRQYVVAMAPPSTVSTPPTVTGSECVSFGSHALMSCASLAPLHALTGAARPTATRDLHRRGHAPGGPVCRVRLHRLRCTQVTEGVPRCGGPGSLGYRRLRCCRARDHDPLDRESSRAVRWPYTEISP